MWGTVRNFRIKGFFSFIYTDVQCILYYLNKLLHLGLIAFLRILNKFSRRSEIKCAFELFKRQSAKSYKISYYIKYLTIILGFPKNEALPKMNNTYFFILSTSDSLRIIERFANNYQFASIRSVSYASQVQKLETKNKYSFKIRTSFVFLHPFWHSSNNEGLTILLKNLEVCEVRDNKHAAE